MEEYEQRFLELALFVLAIVENTNNECIRFKDGLKNAIKTPIVVARHMEFGRLIHFTTKFEKHLNKQWIKENVKNDGNDSM